MFSGIIEEIGIVREVAQAADLKQWDGSVAPGFVLTIEAPLAVQDAYIGCSIAVNGVCLTVTKFSIQPEPLFVVNVAPESLKRTNLGHLAAGDPVNLERAMKAGDRNSGHNVQGHVDSTARITEFRREGDSLWVHFAIDKQLMKYIVVKGYVAIDGTSLTVCDTNSAQGSFSVMLIAHTQNHIILPRKRVGDFVNVEVDVLSKYAEQQRVETVPSPSAPSAKHLHTGTDAEMVEIHRTTHGAGLQVPLPSPHQAARLRVGIVSACWHASLITLMRDKCVARLKSRGVLEENIVDVLAPGSYEIPFVANELIQQEKVDAVICMGILLKGGTIHMEVLASATTKAILDLQLRTRTPIVFGVLTVLKMEQAVERAESDLPVSWADTALCMAAHRTRLIKANL